MSDGVCFEKENAVANDTKSATTLAPTRGFEPPTPRLGGECSILLSYVGVFS